MAKISPVKFPIKISTTVVAESPREDLGWFSFHSNDEDPLLSRTHQNFGGAEKGFSPEELLSLAISNSIVSEFKFLCTEHRFHFDKMEVYSELILSMGLQGKINFSRFDIRTVVFHPDVRETSERLITLAIQNSLLTSLINVPKHFSHQIII